jgi:hypothetical protein
VRIDGTAGQHRENAQCPDAASAPDAYRFRADDRFTTESVRSRLEIAAALNAQYRPEAAPPCYISTPSNLVVRHMLRMTNPAEAGPVSLLPVTVAAASSTPLRRAGKSFRLCGRIDSSIP